jgi:hypothetical protein
MADPGADGVGAEFGVSFRFTEFAGEGFDRIAGVVGEQEEVGTTDVSVEVARAVRRRKRAAADLQVREG